MGSAAGLVGRRAQTAGGLGLPKTIIYHTNILAFAPTIGAKAKIQLRKLHWLKSQAIIRSTNQYVAMIPMP